MKKSLTAADFAVSALCLHQNGGFVVAGEGLHLWKDGKRLCSFFTEYGGEKMKFNDMIADPIGRVYVGTLNPPELGNLYKVDLDGSVEIVEEGVTCSNGLGFSPDEKVLYYTDSRKREIYAYRYDRATGNLSNRRVFIRVPDTEGLPDGLTVDAEGFIWSAQWGGAQVVRYDPDGKVERRVPIPVRLVSSVAFGGNELRTLFITSASETIHETSSLSNLDGGKVYFLQSEVQGKPEYMARIKGLAEDYSQLF